MSSAPAASTPHRIWLTDHLLVLPPPLDILRILHVSQLPLTSLRVPENFVLRFCHVGSSKFSLLVLQIGLKILVQQRVEWIDARSTFLSFQSLLLIRA